MNPDILQLGAGFAGIIIVIKMMVDGQKEANARWIEANNANMKAVSDAVHSLKAEIKELSSTIVSMQIHKGD